MKKILPLSYPPKITPVRTYKCRQTIRKGDRYKVDDQIMFFGWEGKPRHSKWAWRTPYMRVNTVIPLFVKKDGFEMECWDNSYEPDFYSWESGYADYLAELDGIIPPTGAELGRLLVDMHRLFREREPPDRYSFQVLRWDRPDSLEKFMEG